MSGPAMQKALDHIGDEFRPERKDRKSILLQGHRVKTMVEAGRYSFPEACRLMLVDGHQVMDALNWLIDDNARMNVRFDTDTNYQQPHDYVMVGWFQDQSEAMLTNTAEVVQLQARAS